jgi:MoaA/NifB/PqqE/SkfB family radical SAM enzyme
MQIDFNSNKYFKLFIDLTTKCNLNCSYCFARATKSWNNEMTFENFNLLYKYLKNTNEKFYLIMFGGEPLLHSKIDQIINKLIDLQKKHIIIFLSNGLLDFKIYEKVLKNNFIISFTFHQNLEKFLDNLNRLIDKYHLLMQLNILLENENSKYLYEFAIKNKIKYIFTQIYDTNEYFLNPFLFKKLNFIKNHDINLFQDKMYYPDLILNHYKLKNKKKICYFNEGTIDLDLIYKD